LGVGGGRERKPEGRRELGTTEREREGEKETVREKERTGERGGSLKVKM
jgi:hypothetical protein